MSTTSSHRAVSPAGCAGRAPTSMSTPSPHRTVSPAGHAGQVPHSRLTLSASSIQVCFRSSSSIPIPITARMTAWQVATLPARSHSSASWKGDTDVQFNGLTSSLRRCYFTHSGNRVPTPYELISKHLSSLDWNSRLKPTQRDSLFTHTVD